ncbi:MAG TPA: hypothetical protein VFP43_26970 [Mesorhizobium sp.]|nr:hypothetical protein [Mesorhizobium sp.]
MRPELGPALDLGRTKLTIWATTFLLAPALALYLFRSADRRIANLAHLFWLFAWPAFLVHACWAVFVIFDGVADTFRKIGIPISSVNFFLVGIWTLDVLLLWTLRRPPGWLWKAQLGTRVFAFLVFAITRGATRRNGSQAGVCIRRHRRRGATSARMVARAQRPDTAGLISTSRTPASAQLSTPQTG